MAIFLSEEYTGEHGQKHLGKNRPLGRRGGCLSNAFRERGIPRHVNRTKSRSQATNNLQRSCQFD